MKTVIIHTANAISSALFDVKLKQGAEAGLAFEVANNLSGVLYPLNNPLAMSFEALAEELMGDGETLAEAIADNQKALDELGLRGGITLRDDYLTISRVEDKYLARFRRIPA